MLFKEMWEMNENDQDITIKEYIERKWDVILAIDIILFVLKI